VNPSQTLPRIIFEDATLLLVAKPEGLLSVPGRGDDKQDCLISRLQLDYPEARIVHRLDHDTSGIMVLALTADAHRELSRQFHDREVTKRYCALVWGLPEADAGSIDLPLRYDPPSKPRHVVDPAEGQSALTHWQVLERLGDRTRMLLLPHTGRTHQLRVHMQALGHPILGDSLYADGDALNASPRLCLHAEQLSFTHPASGLRMQFTLPAPF
jgi:tRNA pseudouridine32 synthase/23S rRNA pseudouridine746 synthase